MGDTTAHPLNPSLLSSEGIKAVHDLIGFVTDWTNSGQNWVYRIPLSLRCVLSQLPEVLAAGISYVED